MGSKKRPGKAGDVVAGTGSRSGAAVLSPCGRYRYALTREWAPGRRVAWLMLNPSTADASKDDPTIRKCVGFSTRWGFGRLDVVNVAAFRATDPKALYAARRSGVDVVGPDNAEHIERVLRAADLVVVAWGANDTSGFPAATDAYLGGFPRVSCLGRTKNGAPNHPLMLAYATPLDSYPGEARDE